MPKMVTIEINPTFSPTDKAAFEKAKKRGPQIVTYVSAMEAVKLSKGMYRIASAEPASIEVPSVRLEDKTNDELKQMMLALGIKTEKQMKRSDIIALIRKRLDEIEVVDDEGQDAA